MRIPGLILLCTQHTWRISVWVRQLSPRALHRVALAAHQVGGVPDLLDDALVAQELEGQPQGQRTQLLPRLAGGESGRQRLRGETATHRETREKNEEDTKQRLAITDYTHNLRLRSTCQRSLYNSNVTRK